MDTQEFHAALDAANGVAARLKPLLALPDVIRAAIEAQDTVAQAEAKVAALTQQEADLTARIATLESQEGVAEARIADGQARASAALQKLDAEVAALRAGAQQEMEDAREAANIAIANAQADAAATETALNAEIAALVTRRDELQKLWDAERNKFKAIVG